MAIDGYILGLCVCLLGFTRATVRVKKQSDGFATYLHDCRDIPHALCAYLAYGGRFFMLNVLCLQVRT